MTRPRDLIGLAKGTSAFPLDELSFEDLLRLFNEYVHELGRHYCDGQKGGSIFVEWHTESFGEKWTQHSLRRYTLTLDEAFLPQERDYNKNTRIVSLTGDYFRMPEFSKPKGGDWKLGDRKLVTRLCVTNTGQVYLEWYEGTVIQMNKEHPTLPEKGLVTAAEHIPVSRRWPEKANEKLKKLLRKHPTIVYSFGFQILNLLDHEAKEREQRALRDRNLFNQLNSMGRMFGITHT